MKDRTPSNKQQRERPLYTKRIKEARNQHIRANYTQRYRFLSLLATIKPLYHHQINIQETYPPPILQGNKFSSPTKRVCRNAEKQKNQNKEIKTNKHFILIYRFYKKNTNKNSLQKWNYHTQKGSWLKGKKEKIMEKRIKRIERKT